MCQHTHKESTPSLKCVHTHSCTHMYSYTVVTFCCCCCCRYLLVATDSPILLVLRLADWGVVRRLYGLDVDKFHNASVAWHKSSSYIMAGVHSRSCGCVGCAVTNCDSFSLKR